MVVIRVTVNTKPEHIANLKDVLIENSIGSRKFEGCTRFDVYQSIQDDCVFTLYEEWNKAENFDAFRESDYFKAMGAKIFPLLEGKPDSSYFEAEVIPQ